MERRAIIANPIHMWYESEWYLFTYSGGAYTIRTKEEEVSLSKETHHMSKEFKEFTKVLKEFLFVTFPK